MTICHKIFMEFAGIDNCRKSVYFIDVVRFSKAKAYFLRASNSLCCAIEDSRTMSKDKIDLSLIVRQGESVNQFRSASYRCTTRSLPYRVHVVGNFLPNSAGHERSLRVHDHLHPPVGHRPEAADKDPTGAPRFPDVRGGRVQLRRC